VVRIDRPAEVVEVEGMETFTVGVTTSPRAAALTAVVFGDRDLCEAVSSRATDPDALRGTMIVFFFTLILRGGAQWIESWRTRESSWCTSSPWSALVHLQFRQNVHASCR
jgi:hypothetical protein